MKTIALSTCSQNPLILPILENMEMSVSVVENKLNIPFEQLFNMAARINKKRGFLFVSKVLGKHIPVHPYKPLLTSGLLAIEYYEKKTGKSIPAKSKIVEGFLAEDTKQLAAAYQLLKKHRLDVGQDPIIIGFAETATALGHAVFDVIENGYFIPTTREEIIDVAPTLNFKEEHSHAVDQLCYIPAELLKNRDAPVILVDDEMTTGKTTINIIREIHRNYPRKEYAVLSILDWRSLEDQMKFKQLEKELDVTITTVALLTGQINFRGRPLHKALSNYENKRKAQDLTTRSINISSFFTPLDYQPDNNQDLLNLFPYIKETGRFGISDLDIAQIETACNEAGKLLKKRRTGKRTLCLGTGELMYLPLKISAQMGDNIFYHSTTRSPIHPVDQEHYAVKNGFKFNNPENQKVLHYVYNIPVNFYDEVFVFYEGKVSNQSLEPLFDWFADRGIHSITIVTLSNECKGSVYSE
ncbi:phosphoribosyltransferase family protein [Bacillus sp. Marseille-P3661]|uniref:phosphoribosyltransferase family protein n=1 Tax=Bacillus sp. Marseille-P3661 TaxID=1936234 RepID=UPI0027E48675|nr:phosphoribosyltransferase family protein [Bacillus sp. Marseille-P3661]